ncbi:hypothetical protein QYE76_028924 [Lolium multiflorum]|uniref:Uncharacterized protein n=1 Tax=Lolium multiflorum TaxID=4521 RepID=A0AAD8QLW3_LOLMU|nr:hypothetical protein QYE76_028924 [Lolium multiflorum]
MSTVSHGYNDQIVPLVLLDVATYAVMCWIPSSAVHLGWVQMDGRCRGASGVRCNGFFPGVRRDGLQCDVVEIASGKAMGEGAAA